jgi:hypothetical protein
MPSRVRRDVMVLVGGLDGSGGASGEELLEVGMGVGFELGLGALPLYLALVKQDDAIGGAAEGTVLVGDDDVAAGWGCAFVEGLDEVFEEGAGDGVESGGGFVVEEEEGGVFWVFWVLDDGAGEADAFFHAAAEFGGVAIVDFGEADELEGLVDEVGDFWAGEVGVLEEVKGDVFFDGEGVEEGGLLEDHADAVVLEVVFDGADAGDAV